MGDRVDAETRNRIMRANRDRNTGPEIEVRKALFAKGFRYRLHVSELPGKPDIVLPRHRAVVFVHGCYWHGHGCRRRPRAKSNQRFWKEKIEKNRQRDLEARRKLLEMGWRVLVIWECAIRRRKPPFGRSDDSAQVESWLLGKGQLAILSEDGFEECL